MHDEVRLVGSSASVDPQTSHDGLISRRATSFPILTHLVDGSFSVLHCRQPLARYTRKRPVNGGICSGPLLSTQKPSLPLS